jgi:hypothetical protein
VIHHEGLLDAVDGLATPLADDARIGDDDVERQIERADLVGAGRNLAQLLLIAAEGRDQVLAHIGEAGDSGGGLFLGSAGHQQARTA